MAFKSPRKDSNNLYKQYKLHKVGSMKLKKKLIRLKKILLTSLVIKLFK